MSATFGIRLQRIIENSTEGDKINVYHVAEQMGVSVSSRFRDSTVIATLQYPDGKCPPDIALNKNNSEAENNTAVALLLAKYCLDWGNGAVKDSKIEIFYLRELRAYKTSRQVILATRLAIPDGIIEKCNDLRFNSSRYAQEAKLLPNFIDASFHIPTGSGILNLLDSMDMSNHVAPLPQMMGSDQ